ncbi:GFA family protein [Loktanella sp. Alg231-35]|uniref:GFA family protein n=1 Tax=Loktanella sp. Alg231-35 TaxID=1922220 RepID=UPI000D5592DB|nr:GFA family protein [Loktanella sp. Alg231-35]
MTAVLPLKGACLCGASTFTATPTSSDAGVCHCGQCNKWSGGMFVNVYCGNSVVFDAGAPLGSYKGSAWGERIFCKACGSSLVWQMQDGTHQSVAVHAFEDPSQFTLATQIFTDRKPGCYALANQTEDMTEAEVFAKYAPDGGAT